MFGKIVVCKAKFMFFKSSSIFLADILINDENRIGNKFILIVLMMNLIIFVNFNCSLKCILIILSFHI